MKTLEEIKSYIRDINLELLVNNSDVKIDISKRYKNKFRLFYPSRNLIKYITKIGGVLTGSRAIRCYMIDGKSILDRKVNDWDFIVTLDMAFKICDNMNIDQIPQIGEIISIKTQRMWRHPEYSDSYRIGPVDVQLIIRDELPEYNEINRVRISNLIYSLSQKIELSDIIPSNDYEGKHMKDLREIIIKFNSIKR